MVESKQNPVTQDRVRLLLDSLLLGLVGGLCALLFDWMQHAAGRFFLGWMAGYVPPGLGTDGNVTSQVIGSHGLWLIPLVTTLGGLISGAIVYGLAPEAEGHGTDAVVKALHWTGGRIRARVAPVKMVASAITIGSGGSAGREGPTALIAAGIGSIYAGIFKRTERDRRLIVLMGMSAGLSAIFRSPIGTALFAVEVLYGGMEFESEALIYCMFSSIVAYAVNGSLTGWQPLFDVRTVALSIRTADFGWYAVLGAASGVIAALLPEAFYRMRDAFLALKIPAWVKPGVGGLMVGLMALELPQVLGGGYGWIQQAINGQLALDLMVVLLFAKIAAMSLTVSSGGSGGVFAPSLFVGAMLGGIFASVAHLAPAGMVIVGMAAVFGGAARVPVATLLMVSEMTGDYQMLVPAGLAVMVSYIVQIQCSSVLKYGSLYEGQVAGRADSPAHRAEQVELALQLIDKGGLTLPPTMTHLHLAELLRSGVALEMPDGSQLMAGALPPESPWAGKRIDTRPLTETLKSARIVAVLRGKSVLMPRGETVLQPGDRLLVLAPVDAQAELMEHLTVSGMSAAVETTQ